jgi:hypothetical protein
MVKVSALVHQKSPEVSGQKDSAAGKALNRLYWEIAGFSRLVTSRMYLS